MDTVTGKDGRVWTAKSLLAELRYLTSAVVYGWEDDIEDSIRNTDGLFELLPETELEGE